MFLAGVHLQNPEPIGIKSFCFTPMLEISLGDLSQIVLNKRIYTFLYDGYTYVSY